ncbi:MAG: carboxypeptidase regulatory-like domain-containing protein [Pyrinomonadaceae bacterium]
MTPFRLLIATVSLLILSAGSSFVFAQGITSGITGTVTDPNGAVIPSATVVARNVETNARRTVTSNGEGFYSIPQLPSGKYEVTISSTNFKTETFADVLVTVGQTVSIDSQLSVGDTSATLHSEFLIPLIDRESSDVDTVIGTKEIENLPLNGRNYLELALLTPGNAPAPNFDPTKANTVLISSAGQMGRGSNVMLDGTDNNDDMVGGSLINVSQDAVHEFQVTTNRFSAEYGRSGSSIINVVTKSGTNAVRGGFSFFARDNSLQGLPATYDRSQPAPPFDRQQYSFTLGGPIVKDKAFAFGAFEYRDQDGATLVGRRDVPTRTIVREFFQAPSRDFLLNTRFDYAATQNDNLKFRYSFEDLKDRNSSKLDRALGSASYTQELTNRFHAGSASWSHVFGPKILNDITFSINDFDNDTNPLSDQIQLTFPSILDGASFRVPQATKHTRYQFSDSVVWVAGGHTLKFGGDIQSIKAQIDLGVFRQGRIEFVEDFATFDHNGDGQVNDLDLLFAVTLRSQFPDRDLSLPNVDNTHFAMFVQDSWRIKPNFTVNLGVRYQIDSNEKNIDGYGDINPLVQPFLRGDRKRDLNNFAPRVGFNYSMMDGKLSFHGGYGIYYDRIVLELITLERGLDGRALPVAVRAGNVFFLDPDTGQFPPFAPNSQNPFTGFILPGAGASGINIIDNDMQNPMVQQSNLGFEYEFAKNYVLRADYLHNFGTHFITGRNIGVVNNPVVGGPDRVVNLESSGQTFYDGLLLSVEKRFANRYGFRAAYTLSKSFNYANDDQIPFSNGPINSNNLGLEFGPTPNDQRHRFTAAGNIQLPYGFSLSPILTIASGVPMDILLPDASSRIPMLQRNAGGRLFNNATELNAFIASVNSGGGVNGDLLPLAPSNAKFNDNFSSLDIRLAKTFTFGERFRLEPIVEMFNVFNTTNILGVSNTNYSGFGNVLGTPSFGQAITTAGGVFGSGGPRAVQLGAKFSF